MASEREAGRCLPSAQRKREHEATPTTVYLTSSVRNGRRRQWRTLVWILTLVRLQDRFQAQPTFGLMTRDWISLQPIAVHHGTSRDRRNRQRLN